MKEKNLSALRSNMEFSISGLVLLIQRVILLILRYEILENLVTYIGI